MIKTTKAGDLNLVEYGRNLKKAFSNKIFTDIDIIIIENQGLYYSRLLNI